MRPIHSHIYYRYYLPIKLYKHSQIQKMATKEKKTDEKNYQDNKLL